MGAAAIEPALAAIRRGVIVALANKECVVAAGEVFRDALEKSGAQVIPVDSEHNAIFQVLGSGDASEVEMVTITASGGPFREWPLEQMRGATVEQAVAHPNWAMGRKISLDSATLMNKGLELIEAHFLFALPPEKLGVVVHPQSIVHCLVSPMTTAPPWRICRRPTCARPSPMPWAGRAASPRRRAGWIWRRWGSWCSSAPAHDRFPALESGHRFACARAGWRPPCSMPPTRSRCRPSWTAASAFWTFPAWWATTLDARCRGSNGMAGDLETVLGTDARARVLAEEICQRVGRKGA